MKIRVTISWLVEELWEGGPPLRVEFLHAEGLQKTAAAQEQDRKDVKRRREQWKKYQGQIDPKRLIFIGETQM